MNSWGGPEELIPPTRRDALVRQSFIYTACAIPLVAGMVIGALNLYIPLLLLCLIFGAPCSFMAYTHLRDLSAQGVTVTEGEVNKKWTKANLFFFFMRGYYIAVHGKIYSIRPVDYGGLLENDLVHVYHFPHSLTVDRIDRYDEVEKKYIPAGDDGAGEPGRRW
jgi:hypothetical protein